MKTAVKIISLLIALIFCDLLTSAQEPLYITGTPIYAVKENGDLLWFKHTGFQYGSYDWANRAAGNPVGNGWAESLNIFKGDPYGKDGIVYRVDMNSDLYWYKHYGYMSGDRSWEEGKKIGGGWKAKQVISGGDGVLYILQPDGTLWWQKHEGYADGSPIWANKGIARKIGEANDNVLNSKNGTLTYIGWKNAKFIFSGGNSTIYMIDDKGNLYRNHHRGYRDGTNEWDKQMKIGSGWQNFRQVFSGGKGIIYAVNNEGKLLWYKDEPFLIDRKSNWAKNSGSEIGEGWNFKLVF